MENSQRGDDVNLLQFPSPLWHEKDGGRYIGTGCTVITRDPETGWVNLGAYRLMLTDKPNEVTLWMTTLRHGKEHMNKHFERGERIPVAAIFPHPPLDVVKYILSESEDPKAKTAKPEDFIDVRFTQELEKSGFLNGLK